jgi:cephalosporin hydroxylase
MSWMEDTVRDFHRLFYERGIHAEYGRGLHAATRYHGLEAHKCPLDLWIFQEILFDVRPALVIELGTYLGGTTLFLAHQLELLGTGRVVTVDCEDRQRPVHPRIKFLHGDTHDPSVLAAVRDRAQSTDGPVLVIHDADHRYDPCLADLRDYGPLVTLDSYLIVEDTNVNGHPVLADWGPGPFEAVDQFLRERPDFERDTVRERFLMTYNPGGYLRRRS